ncbi:MAG: UDP-N-acetylglucosamine--LPS N-acetylglucosamine transferase [Desulfobulbaceae bacterium]|nr:UDP-N-acetylglucosamine--LPS N-acetylglucosamine transferase [Desulfobulbaceae bacterium]
MRNNTRQKKIMLVASAGGHWVQLNRLNSAFAGHKRIYVTTEPGYQSQVGDHAFYAVPDASRWDRLKLIYLALKMLLLIIHLRPDIIISTGALPGFFAIFFGKKLGSRTIWLDSIANAEELSMSGRKAGKYADLWLTQWESLARPEGPHYFGAVL